MRCLRTLVLHYAYVLGVTFRMRVCSTLGPCIAVVLVPYRTFTNMKEWLLGIVLGRNFLFRGLLNGAQFMH